MTLYKLNKIFKNLSICFQSASYIACGQTWAYPAQLRPFQRRSGPSSSSLRLLICSGPLTFSVTTNARKVCSVRMPRRNRWNQRWSWFRGRFIQQFFQRQKSSLEMMTTERRVTRRFVHCFCVLQSSMWVMSFVWFKIHLPFYYLTTNMESHRKRAMKTSSLIHPCGN